METRTYIVTSWRKTRCPVNCPDAGGAFTSACEHQRWFPIQNHVTLRIAANEPPRCLCTEGRKAGGPRCRQWDEAEGKCEHIDLALKKYDGSLGVPEDPDDPKSVRRASFESGRVDLGTILRDSPRSPKCPHCREGWCVSAATGADKGRWRKEHKGALKRGKIKEPAELWACRNPVCRRPDAKGVERSWVFAEGTEETPRGSIRHSTAVREGFGWH